MAKENITIKLNMTLCTGCGACYNICPSNAIRMQKNSEGFYYPNVNHAECIQCGLCIKSCHALNLNFRNKKNTVCHAVWAEDEIRLASSSAGMFYILAEYAIDNGGYVCGSVFSTDFRSAHHTIASSLEQVEPMRKSKYIQSETHNVYKKIKEILKTASAPVVFSGCPCQVAGLYSFLGKEYDNLYTLDLVCYCAPSPLALKYYIKEIVGEKKITRLDFRPKKELGWACNWIYFEFDDGSVYVDDSRRWYDAFLNQYTTRTCCQTCAYATDRRIGDITLGDFWGIHHKNPEWSSKKGTSLVIINNDKGQKLFDLLKHKLPLCEEIPVDFSKPYNGHLFHSGPINPNRNIFFKHLEEHGYTKALHYARKHHFDAGILGWWDGPNYGSKLVYYGLYKKLEQLGYSLAMIWPPHISDFEFSDFAKKHYRITQYRPIDRLWDLNQYMDSFIVGSDQYWNYRLDNYRHFRMLDFAGEANRKISYATSFGHDELFFPPHKLEEARYFLQRFDHVSVREESAVTLAREAFGVEATKTIDPTFLLTVDDYNALAKDAVHKTEGEYIFAYLLDPTDEKKKALSLLSKKLNIKTIVLVDIQGFEGKAEFLKDFGVIKSPFPTVSDWLYQYKNCKFVVTDSFHGTCFSIIYNKPFITFVNNRRGGIRFKLFEELGLKDRLIEKAGDISENMFTDIDYCAVNAIIKMRRKESIEWLEKALNSPRQKTVSSWDLAYRKISELTTQIKQQRTEIEELKKQISDKSL